MHDVRPEVLNDFLNITVAFLRPSHIPKRPDLVRKRAVLKDLGIRPFVFHHFMAMLCKQRGFRIHDIGFAPLGKPAVVVMDDENTQFFKSFPKDNENI